MRRTLLFAILLAACGDGDHSLRPAGPGGSGPDAILLRIPRDGGPARAYRWGNDSSIWQSNSRVPALGRLLAFDDEQGALAFVDARGIPGRLDLHVGTATPAAERPLAVPTTADGWAIYGIGAKHNVIRLTPSGTWTFLPAAPPSALLPLPDGSLVMLSDAGDSTTVRRVRPPETQVTQTTQLPRAQLVVRTDIGDQLYFASGSNLSGVRVRDFGRTRTIRLGATITDAVATPSGDRIFVVLEGKRSVTIIDRYTASVSRTVGLPDAPSALRMDPDGQFVLARSAGGDSTRIIAMGTSRYIGSLRTAWRADLPLVAPDGRLAVAQGRDVVIVDALTRREVLRYPDGASDLWALIRWNGFRPRAADLDQPVRFAADSADSTDSASADTTLEARVGATPLSATLSAASPPAGAPPHATPPAAPTAPAHQATTFTLSFAALLSEANARTMAANIKVDGKPVRVVPGMRDGTTVYRIVFGPFATRDEAERAGKRSGLSYWVYEGAP